MPCPYAEIGYRGNPMPLRKNWQLINLHSLTHPSVAPQFIEGKIICVASQSQMVLGVA